MTTLRFNGHYAIYDDVTGRMVEYFDKTEDYYIYKLRNDWGCEDIAEAFEDVLREYDEETQMIMDAASDFFIRASRGKHENIRRKN